MSPKMLNRCIFILSIIGILIALYVLQSFLRQSPIVCVNSGCELVRKHPASYIYGIPVPTFGLVGYTILLIGAVLRSMETKLRVFPIMLGVAIFGVSFVTWFTFTEITVIKALCTWCGISGITMVAIFLLLLKIRSLERRSYETHR